MFQKLKAFLKQVSRENRQNIDWSLNRYVWKPRLVKVTPGSSLKELEAQPMFKYVINLPVMVIKV